MRSEGICDTNFLVFCSNKFSCSNKLTICHSSCPFFPSICYMRSCLSFQAVSLNPKINFTLFKLEKKSSCFGFSRKPPATKLCELAGRFQQVYHKRYWFIRCRSFSHQGKSCLLSASGSLPWWRDRQRRSCARPLSQQHCLAGIGSNDFCES